MRMMKVDDDNNESVYDDSMLFHNRPVRADMGSVIVMVECRLSGG